MRAADVPVDSDCLLAGGRPAVKAAKTRSRPAPLNSPFIYRLPYDFKAGEGVSYRAADLNALPLVELLLRGCCRRFSHDRGEPEFRRKSPTTQRVLVECSTLLRVLNYTVILNPLGSARRAVGRRVRVAFGYRRGRNLVPGIPS